MQGFERFVESIASTEYPEKVNDIKQYNQTLEEATQNELRRRKEEDEAKKRVKLAPSQRRLKNRSSSKIINDYSASASNQGSHHHIPRPSQAPSSSLFLTGTNQPVDGTANAKKKPSPSNLLGVPNQSLRKSFAKMTRQDSALFDEIRNYTEIFEEPEDFLRSLRAIEEDCLHHMEYLNTIEEEISRNDKRDGQSFEQLNTQYLSVKQNYDKLKDTKKKLVSQLETRKAQMSTSDKKQNIQPDLTSSEKALICKKVIKLAQEMGVMEKKPFASSLKRSGSISTLSTSFDFDTNNSNNLTKLYTFSEVLDALKDLTNLVTTLQTSSAAFKQASKKDFDQILREYNLMKKEKNRLAVEEARYERGQVRAKHKKEREEEIKRKGKGRKDKGRVWVEDMGGSNNDEEERRAEAERSHDRMMFE